MNALLCSLSCLWSCLANIHISAITCHCFMFSKQFTVHLVALCLWLSFQSPLLIRFASIPLKWAFYLFFAFLAGMKHSSILSFLAWMSFHYHFMLLDMRSCNLAAYFYSRFSFLFEHYLHLEFLCPMKLPTLSWIGPHIKCLPSHAMCFTSLEIVIHFSFTSIWCIYSFPAFL